MSSSKDISPVCKYGHVEDEGFNIQILGDTNHVGRSPLFKCAEEPSLAGFLGTRFQAERLAHEKP